MLVKKEIFSNKLNLFSFASYINDKHDPVTMLLSTYFETEKGNNNDIIFAYIVMYIILAF